MNTPDLTKQAPRSPRTRLGGFVILARAIDKGRATQAKKQGEYHFDCPVDKRLFAFKGIDAKQLTEQLSNDDQKIADWLKTAGIKRSEEEIRNWSDEQEKDMPINNPGFKDYFVNACKNLSLDPAKTTLFTWLEADDKDTFKK